MTVEVCSNCYSPRISPYMGFETGKRYICQDCENIIVVTFEFENMDTLVSFLEEKRRTEEI